ncbi:MAG: HEAT repeat domain-containing protein, partial [Candidatus Poribacteria bacterium]|nr:HEAT repeat domain-containing protein [Candidatus Poribacteria bacterium]
LTPESPSFRAGSTSTKFGKAAVEVLIPMLHDPAPSVRRHAATAFGKIGDTCVTPNLERVANADSNASVRRAACRVLAGLRA